MQRIIRDLYDRELGRANDARSAWAFIEAEWPDVVAVGHNGTQTRGCMILATLLEEAGEAVSVRFNRQIGGVT